jgi:hypothetical protein
MPIDKVVLVPVWHEVPHLFPAQYRAALAWAEEVTNVSKTHTSDEAYAAAAAAFEPRGLVDLSITAAGEGSTLIDLQRLVTGRAVQWPPRSGQSLQGPMAAVRHSCPRCLARERTSGPAAGSLIPDITQIRRLRPIPISQVRRPALQTGHWNPLLESDMTARDPRLTLPLASAMSDRKRLVT